VKSNSCQLFQHLLEEPIRTPVEELQRSKAIQKLFYDFVNEASPIAKTIIREQSLPDKEKTIPPIDAGGIAGIFLFFGNYERG
jgi:hypothetical protein